MHRISWRRKAALIAIVVAAGACGDDLSTNPGVACDGPLTVTASSGSTPIFNWSPACAATFLNVYRADAGQLEGPMWAVGSEPEQFAPLVKYGVTPTGATLFAPPVQLVRGVTYRVTVGRTVGQDVITSVGSATFTP